MPSLPHAVRVIAVAVLAAAAMAQEENDRSWKWLKEWNPVEKGFRKDGDLFPAEYTVDKRGRLGIWPSPSTGGPTLGPEIVYHLPGLQGMSWKSRLTGPVGYFAALFHGDQDFLSLTDAEYHFRKLRLGSTDVDIRKRIAIVPSNANPELRRREQLDRQLAVRLAQRRRLGSSKPELLGILRAEKSDPFLRAAAYDALRAVAPDSLGDMKPPKSRAVPKAQDTLLAMPGEYDVVLRIAQARVPLLPGLTTLGRMAWLGAILEDLRAAGGKISPAMLAGAHLISDQVSWIPYEVVRRFGNFRILRTTIAVRFTDEEQTPQLWFRLDGRFQPERIAARLRSGDRVKFRTEKGLLLTTCHGFRVELASDHVTFWSENYPLGARGRNAEKLVAAGFAGADAVWCRVDDGTAVREVLPRFGTFPFPAISTADIRANFTGTGGFAAAVRVTTEADAVKVRDAIVSYRRRLLRWRFSGQITSLRTVIGKVKIGALAKGERQVHVSFEPGTMTIAGLIETIRRR